MEASALHQFEQPASVNMTCMCMPLSASICGNFKIGPGALAPRPTRRDVTWNVIYREEPHVMPAISYQKYDS